MTGGLGVAAIVAVVLIVSLGRKRLGLRIFESTPPALRTSEMASSKTHVGAKGVIVEEASWSDFAIGRTRDGIGEPMSFKAEPMQINAPLKKGQHVNLVFYNPRKDAYQVAVVKNGLWTASNIRKRAKNRP